WLHREALALQARLAEDTFGRSYADLGANEQAVIDVRVKTAMRENTYDSSTGILTLSADRAVAVEEVASHFEQLFGDDPALSTLRTQYAMPDGALPSATDRKALGAFFFWSSWSASTDRPGQKALSYTSNWPYEPLVGNSMTDGSAIWTVVSVILLITGIAAMV